LSAFAKKKIVSVWQMVCVLMITDYKFVESYDANNLIGCRLICSNCRLVLFCVHWVLTILPGYILQLENCLVGIDL
jgi:hypothetical protein